MVNFLKVWKGGSFWLLGILITVMTITYIVPDMVTAGQTLTEIPSGMHTEIEGIIWLMVLIITTIISIIIPNAIIYPALQEPNISDNKLVIITVAVVMFLLSMILTIKGWYIIEAVYTIITNDFIKALFFLGILEVWSLIVIVSPLYSINQAKQA